MVVPQNHELPTDKNSQDLWIGVSRDLLHLLIRWDVRRVFPFFEAGSGADQGDEVRRVHGAPAGLCRLDELEGHGEARPEQPRPTTE